jgi:branched-chain amino acid transport system permease protein
MTVRVAFGGRGNRIGAVLGAIAFAALAAAPWWGGRDDLQLLSEIYTYVALASLWNLLAGYAGLVSVGQQAYVGLGAYTLFALAILFGVSPLWAIPLAGLFAAGISIPVALLVFRLRGHYFAIGTWIVAEVFRLTASQVAALGGGSGTSLPAAVVVAIAPTRQLRDFTMYWIALFLAVAVLALIFLQRLRISPDAAFSVNDWTAFVIFITVIGGIGRIEGPIIGTLVFFALRQTLADLGTIYLMMLGLVAIVIMLAAPKGIWGMIVERLGWQLFPLERTVLSEEPQQR